MRSRLICYILLFVLIAGHIAANAAWISRDRTPVGWDQADYLALSQRYLRELNDKGPKGLWDAYAGPKRLERERAPLLPILALPFYRLLGNSQAAAMCVNHLALIILCLCVYGIGRQIGGRWLGFIAAYLTMLCPAMFGLSREFFVEFPMTAAIAATIYLSLRAHKQPFYLSVPLIAVFAAAGLLLKVSFPVFAALPLLAIIIWNLARLVSGKGERHLWALMKIGAGIALALLIASTWYLPNMKYWMAFAGENVAGARGARYGMAPLEYLNEQTRMSFLSYHLPALLLLLLMSAAAWFSRTGGAKAIKHEETRPAAIPAVALWFAGALVVCLAVTVKDVRLFFPAMPALAILLAMAYRTMARGWRTVPAAVLLLLPLIAFANFSFSGEYDATIEFRPGKPKADIFSAEYFLGLQPLPPYVHAPNSGDWKANEIVEKVDRNVPAAIEKARLKGVGITVIPNNPYLQPNWLRYVALRGQLEGRIGHDTNYADPGYHSPPRLEQMGKILSTSQFVLVAEGGWQGPDLYAYEVESDGETRYITHGDVMEAVTEIMREAKLFEPLENEIALPDGSRVIIYRHKYAGRRMPLDEKKDFIALFDRPIGTTRTK